MCSLLPQLGAEEVSLSSDRFQKIVRDALATSTADEAGLATLQQQLTPPSATEVMVAQLAVMQQTLEALSDGQKELREEVRAMKRARPDSELPRREADVAKEASVDDDRVLSPA